MGTTQPVSMDFLSPIVLTSCVSCVISSSNELSSTYIYALVIYVLVYYCLSIEVTPNNIQTQTSGNEEVTSFNNIKFPDDILVIEHSVDEKTFIPRSTYKISITSKTVTALQPESNGIMSENIDDFKDLLSSNGFYRIRVNNLFNGNSSSYVVASVPACELQKSGFKEDITIHLDITNSFVIGLSYSSPVIAVSRSCNPSKVEIPQLFLSRLKLAERFQAQSIPLSVTGPRPPELEKVRLPGEEVKDDKNNQQTSFLRKYWYIVLPMVLYMFLPTDGGGKVAAEKKDN